MAIVSRLSVDKAKSVKKAVKRGLTQRLRERVGMGDSSGSDSSDSESESGDEASKKKLKDGDETLKGDGNRELAESEEKSRGRSRKKRVPEGDIEMSPVETPKKSGFQIQISNLEQSMPADAVLGKEGAQDVRAINHFPVLNSCL